MYAHAIFPLLDWNCLRVRTIYVSKFCVPLKKMKCRQWYRWSFLLLRNDNIKQMAYRP